MFISINALREESDLTGWCYIHNIWISIHALREESDMIHRKISLQKA